MSECPICGRDAEKENGFCEYHAEAVENVNTTFTDWKRAMDIEWNDYLEVLIEEETIGKWAREVAEHLMQQGDS